jgi:hypothetical protein
VRDSDDADHAVHLVRRTALAESIATLQTKPVLHGDIGSTLKATTVLAMVQWPGVEPSHSRPRVSRTARSTPQYTAAMVRLACATLILLSAGLAMGCGATSAKVRERSSTGLGETTMSETENRQSFEPLLRVAMGDLAQRLNIDPADISVIDTCAVVWPDRSLGCPRSGMSYAQVPQDGALIRLRAGGREFDYHSGGGRPPFLCEERR